MKRTTNFFLIHNFNTVPTELTDMCEDYIIYDCSTDENVKRTLKEKNLKVKEVENTGHNITSYFSYFVENYDCLPEVICLLKGNMIGRHCSMEFFNEVYDNKGFTFLYDEKQYWDKFAKFTRGGYGERNDVGTTFLAMENVYVEKNNSWYVDSPNHPKKYFNDVDDLIRFIYKAPMIPHYFAFSPGACFIVRKEQILKHSKSFYLNLNKLMNYGTAPNFPSEAHQIERILPIIFTSLGEVNSWMDDEELFDRKLPECSEYIQYKYENRPRRFKKIRKMLGLLK
ncbi:MAG: DUF3431 domain-containing protein [Lachnospiraceae bacterium]|nr:DUF3431 domain-containing protein [Lachnospiraceae bacterium]